MNRTPDQQSNSNFYRQNGSQNGGQNTERPSPNRGEGNRTRPPMTPEQREAYIRRMEAQRNGQGRQSERRRARRRKRLKLNIGITLFVLIICAVLGVSIYQIAQNSKIPGGETKPPVETNAPVESGEPSETDATPPETAGPVETDPPETEAPNTDADLYDTYAVKSEDINLGDLILVNYQYPYAFADTASVKDVWGNKTTSYSLSTTAHKLTEKTLNALNKMADGLAADTNCYELLLTSAYRTTADQQSIYDKRVQQYGEEYAKSYVADPGHSEHHTGMAIDLSFYRAADGATIPVTDHTYGGWLTEHCAEYGFILRYLEDKTDITKIAYEPWHFRFVGKPHAAIVMKTGLCFEEYIGLMKNYTLETKLLHALEDGTTAEVNTASIPNEGYVIYYVPASSEENTKIRIPKGYEHYIVSGNNADGFIVTVYVGQ